MQAAQQPRDFTGRKFPRKRLRQQRVPAGIFAHELFRFLPVWYFERVSLYVMRVVTVRLNERKKEFYVVFAHKGIDQHIVAPVLVYVSVISVSVRKKFGLDRKPVIVSLHIAVLARIDIKDRLFFRIAEKNGISSPQGIV